MKVRAYFTRRHPFYLLGAEDVTDELGFDAYPVEVEDTTLANVRSVRRLVKTMEDSFMDHTAPEDCAQQEADELEALVRLIFKTRAQDNG